MRRQEDRVKCLDEDGFGFGNKNGVRSSRCGSEAMNPTSTHEDLGSIPGLTQWAKDPTWLGAVVYVADVA